MLSWVLAERSVSQSEYNTDKKPAALVFDIYSSFCLLETSFLLRNTNFSLLVMLEAEELD